MGVIIDATTISREESAAQFMRSLSVGGFTSMMIMKASLAAKICQNCMVWEYSFSWPEG